MYFRYEDLENEPLNEEEMDYCPCMNCPLNEFGFRSPDGQFPGPGGPGGQPGPGGFPGPGGQPGQGGYPGYGGPTAPPPNYTPQKAYGYAQPKAVSPGSIRRCMYRYVYIWLDNGRSFWAWLNRVDRRTASGWRWNGRRWVYFGIDLRRIDYFECRR